MPDLGPRAVFSLVRRGVMFELRLYWSLFRWLTRRPVVPSPDAETFGYAQAVAPVMSLWIFASACEVPLIHVLVPWRTVQIAGLVIGIWGLLWMLGFLASLNVHPHVLSPAALRVRNGASVDITVPWDAIAGVTVQRRDLPSSVRTLQLRETEGGTDLQVSVSGQVNVHVVLCRPMTVPTRKGGQEISELSLLADDPRALVTRARQHLTSAVLTQDQPGS